MSTPRLVPLAVLALVALGACGTDTDGPATSATGQRGRSVAVARNCTACHTVAAGQPASGLGPSLVGVFGSTVRLADGSTVIADEAYLVESLVDPGAKVVEGWAPMAAVALTDAEIADLVAYVVDLAVPSTPARGALP